MHFPDAMSIAGVPSCQAPSGYFVTIYDPWAFSTFRACVHSGSACQPNKNKQPAETFSGLMAHGLTQKSLGPRRKTIMNRTGTAFWCHVVGCASWCHSHLLRSLHHLLPRLPAGPPSCWHCCHGAASNVSFQRAVYVQKDDSLNLKWQIRAVGFIHAQAFRKKQLSTGNKSELVAFCQGVLAFHKFHTQ